MNKKTAAEIAAYFDGEVERFSDLTTGQSSIKDARLMVDLFAEVAPVLVPGARRFLDERLLVGFRCKSDVRADRVAEQEIVLRHVRRRAADGTDRERIDVASVE